MAKTNKNLWLWVRDIAIAVILVIVVMQLVRPTVVIGHSMENTLHPDDYIFLSKQAYNFGDAPERGDIVVLRSALEGENGTTKNLIKRVIAVGGDSVEIRDGVVYVNGEPIEESYIKDSYTAGLMQEISVPDGHLFLLGDNRQSSKDSRDPSVGFVAKDKLIGKAVFRVFPFSGFGPLG
jgi:signal peptidase I